MVLQLPAEHETKPQQPKLRRVQAVGGLLLRQLHGRVDSQPAHPTSFALKNRPSIGATAAASGASSL
jgi:hypothetical protein